MFKSLLLLVFLFVFGVLYPQTYKFNQYTTKNGLAQDFIYSINQDNNGYLWIGTGEGLSSFDGKSFKNYSTNDGLADNLISCSYKDDLGNLWFGHNNGKITKLHSHEFTKAVDSPEIFSPINGIEVIEHNVFFITQNEGLFLLKNDTLLFLGKFEQELFYSLKIIDENKILIGTNEGLFLIKNVNDKWSLIKSDTQYDEISIIQKLNKNRLVVGTNNGYILGVSVSENNLQVRPLIEGIKFDSPVKKIIKDRERNLWVATAGLGVVKLSDISSDNIKIDYYNKNNGLSDNYIQTIFQDRERNVWIGTFGQGLLSLTEDYFTFYNHLKYNDVRSIYVYNNTKWFGTTNGLIELSTNDSLILLDSKQNFVDDEITDLHLFDSVLWIGTYTKGLFTYDLASKTFNHISWDLGVMQNRINDIVVEKNRAWIATDGGLIIYDISSKSVNILTTEDGLDHNAIECIYKTKDGRLLMGTYSSHLFVLENSSIQEIEIVEAGEFTILDIDEAENGDIWLATAENGVYRMSKDSIYSYSSYNGLKSNYCYAIEEDGNGKIWVGHRNGLSKINPNQNFKITIYDSKDGIYSQINKGALFLDFNKYLWIGTEEGVIRFDSQKDLQKEVPPTVNISRILINDKVHSNLKEINLKYGTYRLNIEFIGIYLKNPSGIKYTFMLEGYDNNFSTPQKENRATYSKLQDGNYTFKVRAFLGDNEDINSEISIKIIIAKPFWKKWWFYVICAVILWGIIHLYLRYKIQRIRRQKEMIQKELDVKTKQVVESAKKIDTINKDLMSSINYALKLQNSILPPKDSFSQRFPHSFVYYKPRNVVSGDFYFINKCNDKVIFACVDCTGHGVPGAFMSLIGYIALRDVYRISEIQNEWLTPDQVLEKLDAEVKTLLETQSVDLNTNNGMDLILCEYDTKTKQLLVASAKRPIVIYNDGELKVVKGEKRSIGEQDFGMIIPYQLHQFDIKPNDAIYMFSDGFTDQFGGENTKKFGIRKTINLLTDIQKRNKRQQKRYIIETFEEWKSNNPQTDDIIFMGIYF